jgi:hypothetical protein
MLIMALDVAWSRRRVKRKCEINEGIVAFRCKREDSVRVMHST